jgi:hypothetical protein
MDHQRATPSVSGDAQVRVRCQRGLGFGDDGEVPAFPITKARPADAVPAGRMGYNLSAEKLLLHTIQPQEVFDELVSTGIFVSDPSRVEPLHADAYGWLYRQMASRLNTGGDGAVWFWAQIRRQELVELCRAAPEEVLLTCQVPRERVLLSHYGDWHSALNRNPLVLELPGETDEDYMTRLEDIFDAVDSRVLTAGRGPDAEYRHWPEDLRNELELSWQFMLDPRNYGRYESWQATSHCLYEDDVVQAVRLER